MQEKLIGLRRGRFITQQTMADKLNIDLRTYQSKERGDTQFKLNEIFAISEILSLPIQDIFLKPNFEKRETRVNLGGNHE